MTKYQAIKLFLLGFIAALLVVLVVKDDTVTAQYGIQDNNNEVGRFQYWTHPNGLDNGIIDTKLGILINLGNSCRYKNVIQLAFIQHDKDYAPLSKEALEKILSDDGVLSFAADKLREPYLFWHRNSKLLEQTDSAYVTSIYNYVKFISDDNE